MIKRLFCDFDGPVIDLSERYFRVYQFCLQHIQLPQQAVTPFTKAEFWSLKRAQISEKDIALKSGLTELGQANKFAQLRQDLVHTEPYFQYDCLSEDAIAALETAQQADIELSIMTMRRVRELEPVLKQYNLARFFPPERRFCLSNDYVKTGDTKDKPRLMAEALAKLSPTSQQWIVGDTEADIMAGKTHGVKVIAVLCGIRNQTQLELYAPDLIKSNLKAAVEAILSFSPITS